MHKNAKNCKIKLVYFESRKHETNFYLRKHCIGSKEKNSKVINILTLIIIYLVFAIYDESS